MHENEALLKAFWQTRRPKRINFAITVTTKEQIINNRSPLPGKVRIMACPYTTKRREAIFNQRSSVIRSKYPTRGFLLNCPPAQSPWPKCATRDEYDKPHFSLYRRLMSVGARPRAGSRPLRCKLWMRSFRIWLNLAAARTRAQLTENDEASWIKFYLYFTHHISQMSNLPANVVTVAAEGQHSFRSTQMISLQVAP